MVSYIALLRGQYLDIAREGGFWPAFDQSIDLLFDLAGYCNENFIPYIVDLVTFTCGIEYFYF